MRHTRLIIRRLALAVLGGAALACDGSTPMAPAPPQPETPPAPPGRIFFASFLTGNYDIYSANEDGTDLQRLTYDPVHEHNPALSPDGRKVAYLRWLSGSQYELWLMNQDGSGQARLLGAMDDMLHVYRPTWSRNGQHIFISYQESGTLRFRIARVSVSGGQREVLPMEGRFPSPSPDGQHIAFAAIFPGEGVQLVTSRFDGTDYEKRTADAPSCCGMPEWSPDGSRILYTTFENGQRRVRTVGITTGNGVIGLNEVPAGPVAWSQDATRVLYAPNAGLGLRIAYANGGSATTILDGLGVYGSFSWAR